MYFGENNFKALSVFDFSAIVTIFKLPDGQRGIHQTLVEFLLNSLVGWQFQKAARGLGGSRQR